MATTVANILTKVGYRLYPDTTTSIGTTSEPTSTECIAWMNEIGEELLTICVELGSEIGRSTASISFTDGDADYTDLAALLFAPVVMRDKQGNQFSGWIEKTNSREPLKLVTEAEKLEYDPALESEPECFYIDGSNTIYPLPVPDTSYTAMIPYYAYHTALTATTDTVPYMQIFDNVYIEALAMRQFARNEYDLGYEFKWFNYVRKQARKILSMRKNPNVSITV
jgi:hypothetical protein